MKDGAENFDRTRVAKPCGTHAVAATLVLAVSLGSAAVAVAQNAQPIVQNAPPVAQNAQPQSPSQAGSQAGAATAGAVQPAPPARGLFPIQPPPTQKPGFIYEFGRWWDNTRGKIDDLSKQSNGPAGGPAAATQDMLNSAAKATKDAATAIVRLPGARIVEIYQRCATAPNGAPDCRTAAAKACRTKGFSDGHPVNVQSSENCPPAVWMSGREPAPGECPSETVVLMAACD